MKVDEHGCNDGCSGIRKSIDGWKSILFIAVYLNCSNSHQDLEQCLCSFLDSSYNCLCSESSSLYVDKILLTLCAYMTTCQL